MSKLLLSSLFQTLGYALFGAIFGLGAAVCFGFQLTWEANWLWLLISLPVTYLFIFIPEMRELKRQQRIAIGKHFIASYVTKTKQPTK